MIQKDFNQITKKINENMEALVISAFGGGDKPLVLNCGVCGTLPETNKEVVWISEYGVCYNCMAEDHMYEGGDSK